MFALMLCQGISVIKSSTKLRSNLFITGQYYTEEYGTIAGVILVNSILKIMVHVQMLYSQLEDQQVAPPT